MNNIIQIHNQDIHSADIAFAEFMSKAETYLNEKAQNDHSLYRKCNGHELENVVLNVLWEISPSTPFCKDDIILVSGAKFPDIVAGRYYGVEVKSTKEDTWKSTGSSIVENTRIDDVERIYMLFGKLGGVHAEFKCKPYQSCLSNIAVTHSPRYLIDMELSEKQVPTIFDKLNTEYDTFRLLSEQEKVSRLRTFYKEQARIRNKVEMPWWMGGNNVSSAVISLFKSLEPERKAELVTRLLILFPFDLLSKRQDKYEKSALWLVSRYSVVSPNMRDLFSSGSVVDNEVLERFSANTPHIISCLYSARKSIVDMLTNPSEEFVQEISYCWDTDVRGDELLCKWITLVQQTLDEYPSYYHGISIEDLFRDVL